MSALHDRLHSLLELRKDRQTLRSLSPSISTSSRPLVDFSSNDYLSFAQSSELRNKLITALSEGKGATLYGPPSSRLLDGNTSNHLQLEDQLAKFFGGDAVGLLFNSGFAANVSLWTTLPAPTDFIIYDELIHASTHDGMRASRTLASNRRSFKHNSVDDLARVLKEVGEMEGVKEGIRSVWITTETLFSMDGDLAPVNAMIERAEEILPRGNGHWVIDEAHSTGLYGPGGRGVVAALGLEDRITVRVHTFGKAMACTGAVILANPLIRSYLINYARPLIYSTVMPYMNVLAISKSFEMLEEGRGILPAKHVHSLSTLFQAQLNKFLSPTSSISLSPAPYSSRDSDHMPTTTPIIPVLTSNPRGLSAYCISKGFLVRPISYPTVPKGQERVRICLHAGNTRLEVIELAQVLQGWVEEAEDTHQLAAKL